MKDEGKRSQLSNRSYSILSAIAEGRSYDQILSANPELTYHDIFWAAGQALEVAEQSDSDSTYEDRMAEIRKAHPRAYDAWTSEEESRLKELNASGTTVAEIAQLLQRQPSAIRSRMQRLGLID
jgi:DNA-binding NarL/FixJ family response regulator